MAAGDSAGAEARRQLALADEHDQASARARARAGRFGIAEVTERATARALAPLAALGHHLLPDRQWPGSERAQVDMVVVGPGGVFIVDTKAWADVTIDNGRIFRGQLDATDDLMNLADLAQVVEADLVEVGLVPGEVRPLVVLAGRSGIDERVGVVRVVGERDVAAHIGAHGCRLTAAQVDTVLTRAIALFPVAAPPAPAVATVQEPVVPLPREAPEPEQRANVADETPTPGEPVQEALIGEEEVADLVLAGALRATVEEWMTFLHPTQARLIRRSFSGPSRIRGAAGTGKTVVGLHRAAYLAKTRPGTILVTTYVRTLPAVLGNLVKQMAPDVADKIEFTSVHGWARRFLVSRGHQPNLDSDAVRAAFAAAWRQAPRDSWLRRSGCSNNYWKEEISSVLKGRGITAFDLYAQLPRTGRGYRLTIEQRREVWRLYEAYQHELSARGVVDYDDLILLAEAELRREPLKKYSAVIVDEAQDLTAAMIRMLYSLVGDRADGLTLIGDGQQSIYPGGYSLAECGISLAGRGVVLDVNYRNTAEILEFASRAVDGDEFVDFEGEIQKGNRPVSVPRHGPDPHIERFGSPSQRDAALVSRVKAVSRGTRTGPGGVGVLCTTNRAAEHAAAVLTGSGVRCVMLDRYDGTRADAVKIGTIKRAKGLEFAYVLLPDVSRGLLGDTVPPADPADRESWNLRRREAYVAMTRARDGLWLGVV